MAAEAGPKVPLQLDPGTCIWVYATAQDMQCHIEGWVRSVTDAVVVLREAGDEGAPPVFVSLSQGHVRDWGRSDAPPDPQLQSDGLAVDPRALMRRFVREHAELYLRPEAEAGPGDVEVVVADAEGGGGEGGEEEDAAPEAPLSPIDDGSCSRVSVASSAAAPLLSAEEQQLLLDFLRAECGGLQLLDSDSPEPVCLPMFHRLVAEERERLRRVIAEFDLVGVDLEVAVERLRPVDLGERMERLYLRERYMAPEVWRPAAVREGEGCWAELSPTVRWRVVLGVVAAAFAALGAVVIAVSESYLAGMPTVVQTYVAGARVLALVAHGMCTGVALAAALMAKAGPQPLSTKVVAFCSCYLIAAIGTASGSVAVSAAALGSSLHQSHWGGTALRQLCNFQEARGCRGYRSCAERFEMECGCGDEPPDVILAACAAPFQSDTAAALRLLEGCSAAALAAVLGLAAVWVWWQRGKLRRMLTRRER
eukprot:TRINITY_DN21347_c0_g1_i2.p1 TRINITY_DN21347_c0_g1~~TRINITY_DN21347_c0_g1_i2.p1  ORF type:complete len:496 (+),score=202.38 TRINITY_DN21347_c0_g1_i2:51-1490(+)